MGAGRKTYTMNEGVPSSPTAANSSVSARNLRKSDLGGVIFGCKNYTMNECLSNQLFGLPAPHFSYVKNIGPGLPLFLFNYTDRKLHGIYESASTGQMNINPYGWTTDGSDRTSYPAQVRIRIQTQCKPLVENQFFPVIADNFYTPSHFWFELDHAQVAGLMSLFMSAPYSGPVVLPLSMSKTSNPSNTLPSARWQSTGSLGKASGSSVWVSTGDSGLEKNSKSFADIVTGNNKFETLLWDGENNDSGNSNKTSSSNNEDGDLNAPVSAWDCPDIDEANTNKEAMDNDEDMVLLKLRQLVYDRECSHLSVKDKDFSDDGCISNMIEDLLMDDEKSEEPLGSTAKFEEVRPKSSDIHSDLGQGNELRHVVEQLKISSVEQLQKFIALEKKQVDSDREIQQLKNRVRELEYQLGRSMPHIDETLNKSLDKLYLDPEELIFLIGGYDGISWLSSLDSYSPSRDIITSLSSMGSVRSYASAATLYGDIYIFGGGNGVLWYDTVERYNLKNNDWTRCPPLVRKKGSLAGAILQNKIFAIGGGDGVECFSDVEMFDPALGRWINYQPLLQKRFAPAAAELNGAVYAVGGFDGKDYLSSAERFDPREASWTRLQSMNTKRGCLSLAVLNEKLYALGGYDGTKMASSVEVFDPRTGSWIFGDSLNHSRGYGATAVLGDSIYAIGGLDGERILDVVDCYKEGLGWRVTNSKAIGKRCYLSAIVL
ncbi:influenza virus NS1A-binding protein [Tasmannia lanceolata]|uniref:influenza virus NS1A-binding protein n=1 Tax=Tasmannia lanceolata TaxID=3420 RepID=UPI004063F41C